MEKVKKCRFKKVEEYLCHEKVVIDEPLVNKEIV